jgi:tRNA 2-thiouridine synthesizing protein A
MPSPVPPALLTVDARGMRCPWPALRLARAMRDGRGAPVRLLADDPAAVREVAALAAEHGWALTIPDEGMFDLRAATVSNLA